MFPFGSAPGPLLTKVRGKLVPIMDAVKDFLLAHNNPPRAHFSTRLVKFQLAEDLLGSSSWELDSGNTVLQNELVTTWILLPESVEIVLFRPFLHVPDLQFGPPVVHNVNDGFKVSPGAASPYSGYSGLMWDIIAKGLSIWEGPCHKCKSVLFGDVPLFN